MAGILVERVTGAPFGEVLSKRVFEPLGMTDTAFHVPADELARFTSMYAPSEAAAVFGGGDAARRRRPPSLSTSRAGGRRAARAARRAGGLVSTIDDLAAFAAMLAADGGGLLSEGVSRADAAGSGRRHRPGGEPVVLRPAPRLGADDVRPRRRGGPADSLPDGTPRGYGWEGGSGTAWRTDPATGLTGILSPSGW